MHRWAILGLFASFGLVGCVENGPIFVQVGAGGEGGAEQNDSGLPDSEPTPDMGPPTIMCTTNEECQALDPSGNATIRCVDGVCQVISCVDGLEDANEDVTDGCECVLDDEGESPICDGRDGDCDGRVDEATDFTSDLANCGQCGLDCGEGLSLNLLQIESLACRDGQCAIEACVDGWFNPDGVLETGCRCLAGGTVTDLRLMLPDDDLVGTIFQDEISRRNPPNEPRLAYGDDGTGLLVWSRVRGGEPSDLVIRAMRIDASGFPLGRAHTLGQYEVRGDVRLLGLYHLGGGTFAIHLHYQDADNQNLARRIIAPYGPASFDAPDEIRDPEFLFPNDNTPGATSYLVAPKDDDLCAVIIGASDPETRIRPIVEIRRAAELATIPALQDNEQQPLVQPASLMGMACPPESCDCLVAWLAQPDDDDDRALMVNETRIDSEPSPMARVAMAWGDLGAMMIWSREGDDRRAFAARLAVGSGQIAGGPEQVNSMPANDSPHSGVLFADDDGDGEAEDGEGFVLSWANDPNNQFTGLGNEFVRLNGSGGLLEERIRVPWIASGRIDAETFFAETPPRTFVAERLLTRGMSWATPLDSPDTQVAVAHDGPLASRDVDGGWLVWGGVDGVYAARLAGGLGADQAPIVVSRGNEAEQRAIATTGDGGLRIFSAGRDRVRVTALDAMGARVATERPLVWPGEPGTVAAVDAMPWPDGRTLVVLDARAGEARSQTIAFVEDDVAPLELAEPSADGGVDGQLGGPGGDVGALLVSWRDGDQQDGLFARRVGPDGSIGQSLPLGNVQTRGPVDVVHNPVSGNTFVAWLASQGRGCGASLLTVAVYDADLERLRDDPVVAFEPDREGGGEGRCLDWLRVVPNAGGGITAIMAQTGDDDGFVATLDARGGLMGTPQIMRHAELRYPRPMDVLATSRGPVGFFIQQGEDGRPGRLRSVEYRCE